MKAMLTCNIRSELRSFTLDVSLHVNAGEIVALKGENGAGKTTILRTIAGFFYPDAGFISLDEKTIFDRKTAICIPPEHRKCAYLHQKSTVFPHMTVRDNIAYGLVSQRQDSVLATKQVNVWMERLHITDLAQIKGKHLSGGQQQRVALARAFATVPEILLLDEPFTALDVQTRALVRKCVTSYVKEYDIPCLLVTHYESDICEMADRMVEIQRGKFT